MGDLQCPARVYVVRPGSADAAEVVAGLEGERVAEVWSAADGVSRDLARAAAGLLGCGTTVHPGPWPEALVSATPVLRSLAAPEGVFEEVEDRFRGEAVLVVLPVDLG